MSFFAISTDGTTEHATLSEAVTALEDEIDYLRHEAVRDGEWSEVWGCVRSANEEGPIVAHIIERIIEERPRREDYATEEDWQDELDAGPWSDDDAEYIVDYEVSCDVDHETRARQQYPGFLDVKLAPWRRDLSLLAVHQS